MSKMLRSLWAVTPSRNFPSSSLVFLAQQVGQTEAHNSPFVTLQLLLGRLLSSHALGFGLLARSGALASGRVSGCCLAVRYS